MTHTSSFLRTLSGPLVLLPLVAIAQGVAYDHLEIDRVKARICSWGLIGENVAGGTPDFEVPLGGGAHPIFSAGLWIGGVDAGSTLHLAAMKYEPGSGSDYWPGPLTDGGTTTSTVALQYDDVWCVDAADVALQQAYFECLATPGCDAAALYPGYSVPSYFYDWPAHGDVSLGYDPYLAPFNDFNADGYYDPSDGDSPCIPGDKACFVIFNDSKVHALTGTPPVRVEVRMFAFGYNSGDPALDHTVFFHCTIINKSTQTYQNTYMGLFSDFDLGCSFDDFVGSDPARNLVYAYNADNDDENGCSGAVGYGVQPPAFGAMILKGPYADADGLDQGPDPALFSYNAHGVGDAVIDNETYGLAYAGYYLNAAGATGDPSTAAMYYEHLRGHWNDGTSQTYGGIGYGGSVNARFAFPDDTDPAGVGTGGVPQAPWTEVTAGNTPEDRRMLSSMGPFTLEPGAHNGLAFAYVYARAASGGPQASVAALQARVDSVQAFADSSLGLFWGFREDPWCGQLLTGLGEVIQPAPGNLFLYPVPADDHLVCTIPAALIGERLVICDALGRMVREERVTSTTQTLDLHDIAPGAYNCEIRTGKTRLTGRFMKE